MVAGDTDEAWGSLAAADERQRQEQMVARYSELAALSAEERRRRLYAMAQAEYALPDAELRTFTMSRLRAWLTLEPDQAHVIASAYDSVMAEMPATIAMRRVGLVQTLAREFSAEDEDRLRELVPAVFGGSPRRGLAAETGPARALPPKKRAWWAFWQKSGAG